MTEQPQLLAGLPAIAFVQGLWAMLSFMAGMVATVILATVFFLLLPAIIVVALVFGPRETEGRQGWRPVPASA